jgi:Fibronectin type III domain
MGDGAAMRHAMRMSKLMKLARTAALVVAPTVAAALALPALSASAALTLAAPTHVSAYATAIFPGTESVVVSWDYGSRTGVLFEIVEHQGRWSGKTAVTTSNHNVTIKVSREARRRDLTFSVLVIKGADSSQPTSSGDVFIAASDSSGGGTGSGNQPITIGVVGGAAGVILAETCNNPPTYTPWITASVNFNVSVSGSGQPVTDILVDGTDTALPAGSTTRSIMPALQATGLSADAIWSGVPGVADQTAGNVANLLTVDLMNGTSVQATAKVNVEVPPMVCDPIYAPSAPGTVTAVAGDGSATVTWNVPADGGSPITGYTVTAQGYGLSTAGSTQTVTGTSATFTGLTNGDSYGFTVTANNLAGNSGPAYSNNVTPDGPSSNAIVTFPAVVVDRYSAASSYVEFPRITISGNNTPVTAVAIVVNGQEVGRAVTNPATTMNGTFTGFPGGIGLITSLWNAASYTITLEVLGGINSGVVLATAAPVAITLP